MDTQKASFIRNEFVRLIRATPNAERKWGKMNIQQMTEHVTDFFNVSTGKIQLPLITPEEHLPKFKAFLVSEKEFRENTKAPAEILGDEPAALRNESLETALSKLERSIQHFFTYFESTPAAITTHPVFGPLQFEEWILLHYKHVRHHAKQFGLIGE
ncbi:MAG TPA: DinB family protein [Lacibacter sp.]|nr:DinB family protein [Lacibacter sp.]